jgi:hypothetical protein
VGWPPIRAYRMNSLVNQAKLPVAEVFNPLIGKSKNSNTVVGKGTSNGSDKNNGNAKERGQLRSTLFVKVNMDGIPIGRKVDLSAHSCYEALAQKLEDMFQTSTTIMNSIRECFLPCILNFRMKLRTASRTILWSLKPGLLTFVSLCPSWFGINAPKIFQLKITCSVITTP